MMDIKITKIEEGVDNAILIYWSASGIGHGQYTLVPNEDGTWSGMSEGMDKGESKRFLMLLFDTIASNVKIIS